MAANQMNITLKQKDAVPQLNSQLLTQYSATEALQSIKHQSTEFCSELGYDYVTYKGYFPVGEHTHLFCNLPNSFADLANNGGKQLLKLIFRHCQNRTTPFSWTEISTDSNKSSSQLEQLLDEVEYHGIHNGICIPIHGAGAEQGMINVAHKNKTSVAAEDSLRLLQLHAIGVHEAVKHYHEHKMKGITQIKSLSPRERECLDWTAAGKTAWETAKIVGITESTVSFHIRNTIQKLNANNRAHAVAIAMACSLISKTPN